jgi:Rrf2 family protein
MKISSQEEYGLRCLLQIGRQGPEGSLTISELARREGISDANVAKMLRLLRQAGFVVATRGQSGGYCLAAPADEIRVGDVLSVLGGRLYEKSFCDEHAGVETLCTHSIDCSIRSLWRSVQGAVDQLLSRLTLQDLLRNESDLKTWDAPEGLALPSLTRPA